MTMMRMINNMSTAHYVHQDHDPFTYIVCAENTDKCPGFERREFLFCFLFPICFNIAQSVVHHRAWFSEMSVRRSFRCGERSITSRRLPVERGPRFCALLNPFCPVPHTETVTVTAPLSLSFASVLTHGSITRPTSARIIPNPRRAHQNRSA